jgi:D-3-phosphoglycerate dehydrogenase
MPHVLVAGRIHQAGIEELRSAPGVTLDIVEDVSLESYEPLVDRADAVLIRTQPMPARVIERAGRLRIVSRHGVGYDAVDVTALNRRGIPLTVVGDVNSLSVAEQTMMFMLALAKRVRAYDQATRDGNWQFRDSREAVDLAGKTLLLIGFGRIGRTVATLAAAFQMRVMVYDPFVEPDSIRDAGAKPAVELSTALGEADVVSAHIPRATGTPLIGATELSRMKASAIVINTARGGLIDEDALDAALRAGRLAGAGLDVFDVEPPRQNHPLFTNDRVLLTPHAAGLTEECTARMATAAALNILDYFAGQLHPALVVNREHVSLAQGDTVQA